MSFLDFAMPYFEALQADSDHSDVEHHASPAPEETPMAPLPFMGLPKIDLDKIRAMFGLEPAADNAPAGGEAKGGEGGAAAGEGGAAASADFTKNTAIPSTAPPPPVALPALPHEAKPEPINALNASRVDGNTVNESATTIGDGTLTRDNKNTTFQGKKQLIDDRSATLKIDPAGGVGGEVKQTNTTQYSENVSSSQSQSAGADIDANGATAHAGRSTVKKVGENSSSDSQTVNAGYSNGHIVAGYKHVAAKEDAKGGEDSATTYGIADGKANMGKEVAQTVNNKDGSVDKKSTEGKLMVGPDGEVEAEGGRTWSHANADGSGTTKHVGGEIGEGKIGVDASAGWKGAGGGSASVGGKLKLETTAEEPVKVGNRYMVKFKRAKTAGANAGGGYKGAGVSGGETFSDFETGTRWFDSETEAKEFKEHVVERVGEMKDESTVSGALSLEIGESRGHGSGTDVSAGVSGSYGGASLGVAGHESDRNQTDVKRVSANIFEVTTSGSINSGHDVTASGGPVIDVGRGSSDTTNQAVTYQFDLATEEGKKAFEQYQKDKLPPTAGAVKVSTQVGDAHESHENMKIIGLGTASYGSDTSENTVDDKDGKHQVNTGETTHDVDPSRLGKWLGDEEQHQRLGIEAHRENGVATSYQVVGQFGGENGFANRNHMAGLTEYQDSYDNATVKPSGDWTMTANIPPEQIADMEKYDKDYAGLTPEEKMRKLTESVADKGSQAINDIGDMGKQLKWDVELKGDPNFPGPAGREKMEGDIKGFESLLESGGGGQAAAVLAGEIEKEIAALSTRRSGVADPKRYTDLPTSLRSDELQKIDGDSARLEALHHRAMVMASQVDPEAAAKSAEKKGGDEKLSADDKELAKLRADIAKLDGQIAAAQQGANDKAQALPGLLHDAIQGPMSRNSGELSKRMEESEKGAKAEVQMQASLYVAFDAQRELFMTTADPKVAVPLAKGMVAQLQSQLNILQMADKGYEDAEEAVAEMSMTDND